MIILNPDRDYAKEVQKRIKSNGGYCTSKLDKSKDNKCVCKEFKEQETGMCACGLYLKVEG